MIGFVILLSFIGILVMGLAIGLLIAARYLRKLARQVLSKRADDNRNNH